MSTMMKFRKDGQYVCMRVVDRKFKLSDIYMKADSLKQFLRQDEPMDLRDGDDYVSLYHYSDDLIQIRVTHVGVYSTGEIYGRRVNLFVDVYAFAWMVWHGDDRMSLLSHEPNCYPKLEWHSRKALHEAVSDPKSRNALRKYLRYAFQWHGATSIKLYDDGSKSFYFEEWRGTESGICGGLILHVGKDRMGHKRYTYSIHT